MARSIGNQSITGGLSKDMTTFVQADSACFRGLTGTSEFSDAYRKSVLTKTSKAQKQPISKRRQCQTPDIEITNFQFQPIIIPTLYEWQSLVPNHSSYISSPLSLSPFGLQPLSPHELSSPLTRPNKRASEMINKAEEEKAIKERRFYLHPSPKSKHENASEPELLTLFPLTSPRETMS